jgi:peptidoglycan-N-acetylglucosamine deacetylase
MQRRARTAVLVFLGLGAAQGAAWAAWTLTNSRTHQLFGKLVSRVETTDSVVALTFDDGPTPLYTDSILKILADSNTQATFFAVGGAIRQHPDIAARIVTMGHELGNHSYSHHRLVFKTPGYLRRELDETDSLIRSAGYQEAIRFRPPYGKRLVILPWILSRSQRTTIMWDVEPDSYPSIALDPSRIVEYVTKNVRPGSIILLHVETAGREPARAALPSLIGALHSAGYRFVTVSELMRRASRS